PRAQRLAVYAQVQNLNTSEALPRLAPLAGLPILENPEPDEEALAFFPVRMIHDYQMLPVSIRDGDFLHLATVWPPDETMLDWISTFALKPIRWHLAPPEKINGLIIQHFGVGSGSLDDS